MRQVYLTVDRDGLTGGIQISINSRDGNGGGHGYRIAGPKYCGMSETLKSHVIDERDIQEIRAYLREASREIAKTKKVAA